MKLIKIILASLIISAAALIPASVARADTNLIANPSFETASGGNPAGWSTDSYGTNTAKFTYETTGHTGSRSATVNLSGYQSGDAKWYFTPVTITPGTTYTFSDWYKSTVGSSVDAVVTTTAGQTTYTWLGDFAASSAWKQLSLSFKAPSGAKNVTFYHYLQANGTLTTDDYSLTLPGSGTPNPTPPVVDVTAPANGATVAGTQSLTATATSNVAITSLQCKIDGTAVGAPLTAAPYTYNWNTTTLANGSHTITATATNNASQSTTSAKVTVTVNNPAPPVSTNLIANPSVEANASGKPTGWQGDSWGTNSAAFSYETTGHTGTHAVKTTVSGYSSGDAEWYFKEVPVTAGKSYQYSNWYKSTVDTEIDAQVAMTDGSQQYYALVTAPASPTSWAKVTAQFIPPAGAKTVTIYQLIDKNGWVTGDDFALSEYTPAALTRGIVTLTFDDGYRNHYTNALPILDKYGVHSTFYIISNTSQDPDYMTVAQMQTLMNHGNEIDSHTVSHPHLPTLSTAQIDQELSNSQSQLRTWFGPNVADDFATPYGEYNGTVLTEIKKFYRSHRSTDEGYNDKDTFNIYNIKVQNVLNTTTPAQVQAWVSQAYQNHTWLVLVYHEVDLPANIDDPTYSVTPANLDTEIAAMKAKGIAIETLGQAINEITPQL